MTENDNLYQTVEITYFDYDNPETYKLCMKEYGLSCLSSTPLNSTEVKLTISGHPDNIENFLDDFENGDLIPLVNLSRQYEYDEDYKEAINTAISNI